MERLLQDLRLAFRSAIRRPLLGLVAAVSLAIGIGANTAIFSAVNRLLLRPPDGIPEPGRVVELGVGTDFGSWAYQDFLDVRAGAEPLEEVAAYDFQAMSLSQGGEGVRTFGMIVSANYFQVFGTVPSQGRFFFPEEDVGLGEHRVAVVSHDFWLSRLGGNPEVIGSTVQLNRETFQVVGVTRPEFRGHIIAFRPEVYVPMTAYPLLQGSGDRFERRGTRWAQVVGRLGADATVEQAQAAVDAVFLRLAEEYPDTNVGRSGRVMPLSSVPLEARGPVTAFLAALFGLVVFVLLITCANVAGMFLARAGARRREMAIRLSLGSGRGRL
ncbi:MAG: ABC transporter permease, partial [Gemmatimonadetes bacterium]|nr:ABC transporter permease [Gemmatimonadota bacterium]